MYFNQFVHAALAILATCWLFAPSLNAVSVYGSGPTPAPVMQPHPDLSGLLALKGSICGTDCPDLATWNASTTDVCSFEGVFCGFIAGAWRAVSIHLQLDVNNVLFNDSQLAVDGAVQGLPFLRDLELICLRHNRPVAAPLPMDVKSLLMGISPQQQHQQQQQKHEQHAMSMPWPSHHLYGTVQANVGESPLAALLDSNSSSFATDSSSPPEARSSAKRGAGGSIGSTRCITSANKDTDTNCTGVAAEHDQLLTTAAAPGDLPPSYFTAYPHLSQLRIVGCGATGKLPKELGAAKQLTSLVLGRNKLTGPLPEQLVQLQALAVLDLSNNNFHGSLPTRFAELPRLAYLYLNANNLTVDSLPCEWAQPGGLPSLKLADLSGNNWVGGGVPDAAADGAAAAAAAAGVFGSRLAVGKSSRCMMQQQQQRASAADADAGATTSRTDASSSSSSSSDGGGGGGTGHGAGLYAPRCWLRRFCYDEGAFICLQRHSKQPQVVGGCRSYVYGASDFHIDPANQCDHGGVHLVVIMCLWGALMTALLLIWLHHCRMLRVLVQAQQQQQQQWRQPHQRQWLVTGPTGPGSRGSSPSARHAAAARGPAAAAAAAGMEQTLPLLYYAGGQEDAAGYVYPASPLGIGSTMDRVHSDLLPSALVTPPATSAGGARYMVVRGLGVGLGGGAGYDRDRSASPGQDLSERGTLGRLHARSGRSTPNLLAAAGGCISNTESSCFSPALMVPLLFLLADVMTDVRLLLLWGLGPPAEVKLWPSYVLLGFVCVPHVLVGAVVQFRLLAAACLPPALEAAAPGGSISGDILPPGALMIKRMYGVLFAAPCWVAYPMILLLLLPGVALLSLLCPLTLLMHAVGLASHQSVVRYLQLLQGCAALTEAPGCAVLLTVLFVMGNVPLEWAFLDSALFYVTIVASMADMGAAWYMKLANIRQQQLLQLAMPQLP